MKIAIFTPEFFYPWNEAVKNFTRDLAVSLSKNKISVLLFYRIGRNKGEKFNFETKKFSKSFYNLFDIIKFLKKNKIKILHFIGRPSILSVIKNIILLLYGFKIIYTIPTPEKGIKRFILFLTAITSHKIVVPTNYMKKLLKIKCKKIPFGVNIKKFEKAKKDTNVEKKIKKKYDLVFLFASRVRKERGLHLILEAIASIKNKEKILLIISNAEKYNHDSDYIKKIKEMINKKNLSSNILFLDYHKNIASLYRLCDVLIISTQSEYSITNIPLSAIEFFSQGKPVIAFKIRGFEETIVDGYNGFLIDKSILQLKKVIEILLDKKIRNKLGKNAKKFVKNFELGEITKNYISVYNSVINNNLF